MTEAVRTVVVERALRHPPERVWRALTTPHLLAEWLMPSDFRAEPGHAFAFRAGFGPIACEVLEADPPNRLVYTWRAFDLDSTVVFTLTPTATGTRLRMEQTGFTPDQTRAFHGARAGWTGFLDKLETTLGKDGT